jgi:tetratricopeptide (TPR) repeat protein
MAFVSFVLIVGATTAVSAQAEKLGAVDFKTSCSAPAHAQVNRAVALLHSFSLDPAVKGFAEAGQTDPSCGIAYWGMAMAWMGNPLAGPPSARGLKEGGVAVERAKTAGAKTQRERDYIAAVELVYQDAEKVPHKTRVTAYDKAMEQLSARYPDDREAAIFYALALNMTLNPNDKTYANQLKAAGILEKAFAEQPNHPGVAHYLIHSYDFPPIAQKGLPAAKLYAAIAPSAPHALHMPSHIFTRVGAWQDSIDTNRASARAAQEALKQDTTGLRSYEGLHAYDYMMYGYMQLGREREARALMDDVLSTTKLNVDHFAGAFALAAIPARYALERGAWADAAKLEPRPSRHLYADGLTWFAKALGAARSGDAAGTRAAIEALGAIETGLTEQRETYWAEQTAIQRRSASAWLAFVEGRRDAALVEERAAAALEDGTEKSAVTPGPLAPAREQVGELLLLLDRPADALAEFETTLEKEPNRFRAVSGAARSASLAGNPDKARRYSALLLSLCEHADSPGRPELEQARRLGG